MRQVKYDHFPLTPVLYGLMCALCTLGLVTFVRAAQAQTSPQPATSSITMPEVTVQETRQQGYAASTATTATKLDTPILDVPQSIQVVPRQVIDEQRAITLSDVFRNVSGFSPGVNSQSQRFGDRNVIFRGFTGNNYYRSSENKLEI